MLEEEDDEEEEDEEEEDEEGRKIATAPTRGIRWEGDNEQRTELCDTWDTTSEMLGFLMKSLSPIPIPCLVPRFINTSEAVT